MLRPIVFVWMLFLARAALAQPVIDPADQAVIDANRAIQAHNDKIAADNAAAQAAYRQEVARVEAERRANEAGYAAVTAAFATRQAQYEADVAAWRTETARVAAQARSPQPARVERPTSQDKPGSATLVCRRDKMTGSNMPGKRVCRTQAQWDRGG